MRIGVDVREVQRGRWTGIGRYLHNLLAYASASHPEHELLMYGNQHTDVDRLSDFGRTHVEEERRTLWWDQIVLPRMARADGVDVFLSPYFKGPLRVSCPLVVTIHDLIFLGWKPYDQGFQRVKNLLQRWEIRRVGKRADLILADSQHTAADIQRFLDLDAGRIRVVPMAVEPAYHPRDRSQAAVLAHRHYGIQEPFILYLGNFKPHKNVAGLIEAYAGLSVPLREQAQLVLAGRPDAWTPTLRSMVERHGLGNRIRFIGQVDEEHLPALLSAAQLLVFPSLYEGFGLPPLEAMACGTAVVASCLSSVPEVVGDAGVLVDPRDVDALRAAIARVLSDDALRAALGEKGLQRSARFRIDAVGPRQLEVLEEAACSRRDRS